MPFKNELSHQEFQAIKIRAEEIKREQDKVKTMFEDLADMYWISETDANIGNAKTLPRYNHDAYGDDDIRLTATTSSRDRVAGIHRMMRTTKPQFEVKCRDQAYADRIEAALDDWWDASNGYRRATVESELTLSGILFSDENLSVTFVDDLIAVETNTILKRRLEELRKKTPILFDVDSPLVAYPVRGKYGLSEYLIVTDIKGRQLREEWGVENKRDNDNYTLWDYWSLEFVCTWLDNGEPIRSGRHQLSEIPRFNTIADGTDLFFEEERKRQPFLYGMWKSGLHKREDELLTSMFTSTYARGHGALVIVDKSAEGYDQSEIEVIHKGLVRILAAPGRPQLADDKAFDSNLINLAAMLKSWGETTTIPAQTLGENISPGTPFSGYAMASQNGRIPIIPIQEATEKCIHDGAMYALVEYKERGVEWEGLKASEILDDVEVIVKMEVDLPQDAFRNAQTLASIKQSGVPVTNEWMHTQLQIKDSKKMTFDFMKEQAAQLAFQQGAPGLIQQLTQMFQAAQQPQGPQGQPQGPMPNENALQYPTTPGGPEAAAAGGQVMPAVEPQIPGGNNGRA